MHCSSKTVLKVAARSSPLSRVQVEEVFKELSLHFQEIVFETLFFSTPGDRDQSTSLRALEKTDFFTKDLDTALLNKECDIAIHSAKDLPEPLPEGLEVICLTKGIDSSDSLVLSPSFNTKTPLIATSSERREKAALELFPGAAFCDLRGTIHERLKTLENGRCDAVVIAESALIRLQLTHLKRMQLPGKTAQGQGRLAIVSLAERADLKALFAPMDERR